MSANQSGWNSRTYAVRLNLVALSDLFGSLSLLTGETGGDVAYSKVRRSALLTLQLSRQQ